MTDNIFIRPGTSTDPLVSAASRLGEQTSESRLGGPPVALARPNAELTRRAPTGQRIRELLEPFEGKSVGQGYRGPAWVDDTGLAWVVVVTRSATWVRAARHSQRLAFITWRWDRGPAAPVSLTAVVQGHSKLEKPAPRWFGASDDPVVAAIRQSGRFMVMLAEPGGVQGPWLLATYDPVGENGLPALERQFTLIRTPGIRGSERGVRYDPSDTSSDGEDQIPLWPESRGDFWATLKYEGPWGSELQHVDRLQATWGYRFLYARSQAAGAVELLRDRFTLDGEQPYFNADGTPTSRLTDATFDGLSKAATEYPEWAKLAAAVAGPAPDVQTAYIAAIACVSEPHNCWGLVSLGVGELPDIDDEHLLPAFKMFTELALLSPDFTQEGLAKPWLANAREGLVLKATLLELSVAVDDVETYWRQGLELQEVIDSGLWARGADLPYSLAELGKRMAGTTIEVGVEAAEARTMALLKEAIEARQWSIPWGARVELSVGPFIGLRIYEVNGEFTCLFVDERGLYYHVAIGLRQEQPQFCSARFLRAASRDSAGEPSEDEALEWDWDDESRLTLQLIAAAIVRDFLVVEERETLFGSRSVTKRIKGHDVKTVVYLPRVMYHRPRADVERPEQTPEATAVRPRHTVAQHLRKVGEASAAQRFLAQRYGVHLPKGFTFVRPHERGAAASQERVRIYRSRSASHMLFEVVETAPSGMRPEWFEFEKDCARLLRKRGLTVQHQAVQRDGDGGVDLYLTDRDGAGWVVQCKCWALYRPVGPEVVRELHGAIAKADAGSSRQSSGILITTSRFTSGALELAKTFGYECIDGEAFAGLSKA